jgi:hypothetical protein
MTSAAAPPVWASAATRGQPNTTLLRPLKNCQATKANTQCLHCCLANGESSSKRRRIV